MHMYMYINFALKHMKYINSYSLSYQDITIKVMVTKIMSTFGQFLRKEGI